MVGGAKTPLFGSIPLFGAPVFTEPMAFEPHRTKAEDAAGDRCGQHTATFSVSILYSFSRVATAYRVPAEGAVTFAALEEEEKKKKKEEEEEPDWSVLYDSDPELEQGQLLDADTA